MKKYINKYFLHLFAKFEFGIYYFTRAINIISEQNIEQQLDANKKEINDNKENIKNLEIELSTTNKFVNEIFSLFELIDNEELKQKLNQIKNKHKK